MSGVVTRGGALIGLFLTLCGCDKPKPDQKAQALKAFVEACGKRLEARTAMPSLYRMVTHEDSLTVASEGKGYDLVSEIAYDLPNKAGLPIRFKAKCQVKVAELTDYPKADSVLIDGNEAIYESSIMKLKRMACEPFEWDLAEPESHCLR